MAKMTVCDRCHKPTTHEATLKIELEGDHPRSLDMDLCGACELAVDGHIEHRILTKRNRPLPEDPKQPRMDEMHAK